MFIMTFILVIVLIFVKPEINGGWDSKVKQMPIEIEEFSWVDLSIDKELSIGTLNDDGYFDLESVLIYTSLIKESCSSDCDS